MMLKSKILACLLAGLVVVYAESNPTCRGSSLECMSQSQLHSLVRNLQSKYTSTQSQLSESNCTICNVLENVCLNGGTCLPEGGENYRCSCPYNYTGEHCETAVVCTENACGANSECRVFNHRVNCNCKLGFLGDPYTAKGCNKTEVSACMYGDPHFYSFDKNFFDYQGTCPYVVSKNCKPIAPYADYVLKARNALAFPGSHESDVVEIEFETHGITVHVDQGANLYVDGVLKNYPFYYPNDDQPQVWVENNFGQIVINTIDGYQVLFRIGYMCLTIPDVPELQGSETLCGLLGNRDKNCKNDMRMSNGTVITDDESATPCSHRIDYMPSEFFGDSWMINKTDFLETAEYYCEPGRLIANATLNCTLQDSRNACALIQAAETGSGVFKVCADLGKDILEHLYDDCVGDVCIEPSTRCPELVAFVEQCQSELPFADPGNWRAALDCPAYYCPPDSTYSSCASRCQPSCAYTNGTVANGCVDTCTEGCMCNPGYVVDNTKKEFACIKIEECGCVDAEGNSYAAGSTWLDDNCQKRYTCLNGTIRESPNACSAQGQCVVDGGVMECKCIPGYQGNGYDCIDINECEQPTTCNQMYGWGNCTNTPGSYYCNCSDFFVGDNCQIYEPKRHCADLYVYNNIKASGPYLVYPEGTEQGSVLVYCDMEKEGGGWTLVGNSANQANANKTFAEYERGFGSANQKNGFVGLKWLYALTNSSKIPMSLRIELERCVNTVSTMTYCTYPEFAVNSPETQYSVYIPEVCQGGNETNGITDGWIRWDQTKTGPKFYAFDNDVMGCSVSFLNTGWWYNPKRRCGPANLNGVGFTCDQIPDLDDISEYMEYNGYAVASSQMYLRPREFPEYDSLF